METLLLCAILLVCGVGLAAGRRVASAEGWTTAGKRFPSWLLALSWISAEFSAMTMIGVPAVAYRGDWTLLQFFLGSAFARVVVAFVFLGRLYGEGPDVYAFLERRFGATTRRAASGLFAVVRSVSASVRLMAVAAVAASFLGTEETRWIWAFAAAAAVSVSWGGLASAVWTGAVQAGAILLAGLATLWFLAASFEGGLGEALRVAENAGRLGVWSWKAPAAVLTGFFGSLAAFGTDQENLQRLFAARSRLSSQRAVIFATVGAGLVLCLFLSIGTGLFVFYEQRTALALPASADSALAHFAVQVLGDGRSALLLAGLVLASIDLPLVGLATVLPGPGTGRAGLARLRAASAAWALLLAFCAALLAGRTEWVGAAFKIGGVVYGPLLGVFLYGFFGPKRGDSRAAFALAGSAGICAILLYAIESGRLGMPWHWLPLLGTAASAGLAHDFSGWFGTRGGRRGTPARPPRP
jgi:uncharacterized sodium:solute symporter family permease YidK